MAAQDRSATSNTNRQMFTGSAWMIALRWTIRLTGLISTIILARLLVPADFGIVAMAMVFVGMLEIFNQTGQKLAIIRHQNPTRAHYDTAWTISIIIGLFIGLLIAVFAPLTSIYFHEPRAVPVMQCLALRAAMGGFENIGTVDFRRDIRFDRFFLYNMYPKLVSFAVTIVLAVVLRNYWALVAGILTLQFATVVASYVMHPYRPRFSLEKFGEIRSFSGWTLFRTIGSYFNAQIDQIAVGGVFGASVMGRYTVAADVASSPTEEINGPMVAVLYPVMAAIRNDPARLRQLYLRTLCWSAIICASASVGVSLVAHDMVAIVLGAKWLNAEPLIGYLALSAGMLGLSSGAYTTFDALGKPHLGARMQWVRLIFLAICIVPVALMTQHPRSIALTRMLVTAAFIPTLLTAVGREIHVSIKDYVSALWRPLLAAIFMASLVSPINALMPAGDFRLMVDVLVGALSYGGSLLLLWRVSGAPDTPERDILAAFERLYKAAPQPAAAPSWLTQKPEPGTIVLYVPISKKAEYAPLHRSPLGKLKAVLSRMRDLVRWTVFRSNDFDFYSWCTKVYTNRGDIAIREAISQLVTARFGNRKRYVELDWGSLNEDVLDWINANAEMFVICGGGYVSADAASGRLSRAMNDVQLLSRMTCPVIAFGIGYNSLLEYRPEERISQLPAETLSKIGQLSHALRLTGVRDRNLKQLMSASAGRQVELIGDPALFLDGAETPRLAPAGTVRIGVNFALHGPVSAAIFKAHFDSYVALLRKVSDAYKAEFFYFVHCDTEMIVVSLLKKAGIKLSIVDKPPAQLVSMYAQMDFVISQMLHSSILAMNAGIPAMNVGYDKKNASFYELMGLSDLCLPHDEATDRRLWALFVHAFERRNETAQRIANRKAELREQTQRFLDEMAGIRSERGEAVGPLESARPADGKEIKLQET